MMSVFDFIAHFYDCGSGKRENHILEEFKKDDVVLDLGGGTGRISQNLECTVVVCDISFPMLRRARAKGMRGVRADASRLPFKKAFTKIIIVDALHHFRNREDTLREAARVLRRGGTLLISDFDPKYFGTKVIAFFERVVGERSVFLSPQTLREILERHGFSSFSIEKNDAEFLMKATKA
jgi:demethylmenaquinone methyltransferase/2-methoxy-6-polyprenyl-1,4-benzoquinol methylase